MYDRRRLETALQALGELLADQGHSHRVVAIGGGALSMMGLVERSTEDLDLVGVLEGDTLQSAEPLPSTLVEAISDVAKLHGLQPKWMNNGPTSLLVHGLPEGFLDRCTPRTYGGLTVLFASRFDQIHLKLLASNRLNDKHHADLRRLQPTREDLLAAASWARTQAVGEVFEMELRRTLASFGVEFADG
ncbi:MAG TPA: DUF6036 family nucleotidyltransferase [Kofleriaceae bacterium]|nr:DUF6036 family nucleotidyltransferase [Kofleriaceae bacterium]